jgi:DNA repair exonuclease SbcCD ATPase subunit
MSTATFKVNPITIPPLECPKVILPTKADLVNMFSQLANLPAQLIAAGQEEVAKQIQDILDDVRSLLSIYDPKFEGISIPEIEWEIMITRLVQDYPMYVQSKIMELISKLLPIDFEISVLGLKIDILKIFTPEGVENIKKQLSGMTDDMKNKIEALKDDLTLSPADLQKELQKLADIRAKITDKFWDMLPESYKLFGGDFGLSSIELKVETIWSYIRSKLNGGMTGLLADAFNGLIKLFKIPWELLGLPDIPLPLPDLNVESILQAVIDAWKKKVEEGKATYADLIEELEKVKLVGFDLLSLIGGKIEESIETAERKIERLMEAARDFAANWPRYLLIKWMELVTKFFEVIGLGKLVEFITFTFCDFLNVLGFPKTIDLSFSEDITVGETNTSPLPT